MFTLNRWKAVLAKSRMTGMKNGDVEDNVGNNDEVKPWNHFHSTILSFSLSPSKGKVQNKKKR